MKTILMLAVAALPFALTACGGSEEPSPQEVDVAVATANEQAEAVKENAENAAAPVPAATPTLTEIPMTFIGRWGLVPGDCQPGRADAKGLVEIDAGSMKFYESRARLTRVIGSGPQSLEAEFAYTGEGQEWVRTETLALSGPDQMVRTSEGQDLRYTKCPR